jgi:hypothetical protein
VASAVVACIGDIAIVEGSVAGGRIGAAADDESFSRCRTGEATSAGAEVGAAHVAADHRVLDSERGRQ